MTRLRRIGPANPPADPCHCAACHDIRRWLAEQVTAIWGAA